MSKYILFAFLTTLYLNASNIVNKKIYITSINTTSHEYVYKSSNTNYKLSELIWEANDVNLLGLELDYLLANDSIINLSYKLNINDADSMMNDYDWLKNDASQWSDWSSHPNTKLEHLSIFDINIKSDFKKVNGINSYITIGYRYEDKEFKAYDGSYVYSSTNGFRDLRGTFSGLGITYKETFSSLYAGIGANKEYKKFNFKASFTYSPNTIATNEDTHHNRSFTNTNTFSETTMTAINLSTTYKIQEDFLLSLEYKNIKYAKTQGTTSRYYYDTTSDTYTNGSSIPKGSTFVYDGAGISNSIDSLNIGIIKKF